MTRRPVKAPRPCILELVTTAFADKRAILRRVRAFAGLSDDECDAVLAVLRAQRGNPGDVLFREGAPGDALMIVLEGELTARVRSAAGTEEEVARLGPGEVVGEMAFIDAEPRSATVSTPGGATVLTFTRAAFRGLETTAPRVAAAILRNVLVDVARRLRDAGERLSEGASSASTRASTDGGASRTPARALTAEQLRAIPALASYAREDLELLAYVSALRSFPARTAIVREGAEGDACFLVVAGTVVVTRQSSTSPLATLGPGALVGQLALLDRAPRSATVTAQTDVMALEVKAAAFANLVNASSPIALRFQKQVALAGVRQLRGATRKVADGAARDAIAGPSSMRMIDIDDWDEGAAAGDLELAVDPASLRSR